MLYVAKHSVFSLIRGYISAADGSTSIVQDLTAFYKPLKQDVYKSSLCLLQAHTLALKFTKQKYFRSNFFQKSSLTYFNSRLGKKHKKHFFLPILLATEPS